MKWKTFVLRKELFVSDDGRKVHNLGHVSLSNSVRRVTCQLLQKKTFCCGEDKFCCCPAAIVAWKWNGFNKWVRKQGQNDLNWILYVASCASLWQTVPLQHSHKAIRFGCTRLRTVPASYILCVHTTGRIASPFLKKACRDFKVPQHVPGTHRLIPSPYR